MKPLAAAPTLVEQVHEAILAEIAAGTLAPGERVIQEQIATDLGVSRQPVQQALLLLRNQGLLHEAPGRGLIVAPLDLAQSRHMYEVRAVMEGLAARKAAERHADVAAREGPALIEQGRKAVRSRSVAAMIAADLRFHGFLYRLSENPLIGDAMAPHWAWTQRVMGEVLTHDERPRDIWDQHAAILDAVAAGDGARAEKLARQHVAEAGDFMLARLGTTTATAAPVSSAAGRGATRATATRRPTARRSAPARRRDARR